MVCLTYEKGIQAVLGQKNLDVYCRLLFEEMNVTEIARSVGIPFSTANAIVNHLMEKGIITKRPDPDDSRSCLHRASAQPLLLDSQDIEWEFMSLESALEDYYGKRRTLSLDYTAILCTTLFNNGIDLWPMITEFGNAMAKYRPLASNPTEICELMQYVRQVVRKVDLDVDAKGDLRLFVKSDRASVVSTVPLMGILMGYLRCTLPPLTGHNYSQLVDCKVADNGRYVETRSHVFKGELFEDSMVEISRRTPDFYKLSEKFSVFYINGKSYLFTDTLSRRVLDAISDEWMDVSELSLLLGAPVVSIYSSLQKLNSMGAVSKKKRGGKTVFSLNGKKVVTTIEGSADDTLLLDILDKAVDGEWDLLRSFIRYFLEYMRLTGISIESLNHELFLNMRKSRSHKAKMIY